MNAIWEIENYTDIDTDAVNVIVDDFIKKQDSPDLILLSLSSNAYKMQHSPIAEHHSDLLLSIQKKVGEKYYLAIWWDTLKQKIIIRIREYYWIDKQYEQYSFIKWLESAFDSFRRDIRPIAVGDHAQNSYNQLGTVQSLDLTIVESKNTISQDIASQLMNKYHLNNVLIAYNNDNLGYNSLWREFTRTSWRLELWQRKLQLSKTGKIQKCVLSGKMDGFFFGADINAKISNAKPSDDAFNNLINDLPILDLDELIARFKQNGNNYAMDFVSTLSWQFLNN